MRQHGRASVLFAFCILMLCGAVAGGIVARRIPLAVADRELELRPNVYEGHWQDRPFEVDAAHRLPVPWLFGDFDLQMEVELGAGARMDVLMRIVEPRILGNSTPSAGAPATTTYEQFSGRFSALRLSTGGGGEPWLSRERCLLGDRDADGIALDPGLAATVWVQGRGRMLRANVAGKWQPWFEADDPFGCFLITARGGNAVVRSLVIRPCEPAWAWWTDPRWWIGAGAGVGVALAAIALALGLPAAPIGLLLVAAAWLVGWSLRGSALPQWTPPPSSLWLHLAVAACVALCVRVRLLWLLAVAAVLAWQLPAGRIDERALDAVFGPKAGPGLTEAAAQLVRGPNMIHDAGKADRRVFLLGGGMLYASPMFPPEQHLESLLTGDLRALVKQTVDVPCLPTVDGWSLQQWRLFSQFYRGYSPHVLVFGVGDNEAAIDPATGKPRSQPSDVRAALVAAADFCRQTGGKLVLFAGAGIGADFLAVLREQAANGAVPLVEADPGEAPEALSKRLATLLAPMLP